MHRDGSGTQKQWVGPYLCGPERKSIKSKYVEGNPSKTKIKEILANKLFHYKLVAKGGFWQI